MQRADMEYSLAAALMPPPGFSCVGAAFSTYSLDLEAFLAVLISLNSVRMIENEATIVQVQRSIMRLAKNVVVLCQRGRITVPKTNRRARILTALDRCIDQKPYDERQRSWHAKCALVAYKASDDTKASYWRLWIGSRNLTRSTDRDIGVLLEGRIADIEVDQSVSGLGVALADLFGSAQARLPRDFFPPPTAGKAGRRQPQDETPWHVFEHNITWSMPAGVAVQGVSVSSNAAAWQALFVPPQDRPLPIRLTLLAPFVDTAGLTYLNTWQSAPPLKAQVLSIADQLHSLRPDVAANFDLQEFRVEPEFIVQPQWPQADQESQDEAKTEDTPAEWSYRGIHAKMLIAAYKRGEPIVILGSPNLTRRGIRNFNMELAIRLTIKKESAAALMAQLETWVTSLGTLPSPTAEDLARDELDRKIEDARKAIIASFDAELHIDGRKIWLHFATAVLVPQGFTVEIALQTRPNEKIVLRPGAEEVLLLNDAAPQDETDLVLVQLMHCESRESVAWVQVVPFPALTAARREQRDYCLAADLMSLADLDLLIAAELGMRTGAESSHPWHRAAAPEASKHEIADTGFSLESLLRHRMRQPDLWRGPWIQQVQSLLDAFMASPQLGEEHKRQLEQRCQIWSVMVAAVKKWGDA